MLKKLLNFLLLSNGISATDERDDADKWSKFRAEREAWEHEQALKRSAPQQGGPAEPPARADEPHQ